MSEPIVTKNKQTIILEVIRAGGATRESIMTAAGLNKAGLASQLAYLNSRGLAMAEVDKTKAEFPIQNEDGTFRMGSLEEYEAKRKTFGASAKPKTKAEVIDAAQKREDKASAAYSKAADKAKDNPTDDIFAKVVELRKVELELASMKLARVQAGDFSYEACTIIDGDAPAGGAKGSKKGKEAPAPGTDGALV